jgi:nucleoside-diphosphate-sugar epimerase
MSHPPTVLVTGASGLVGRRVVTSLLRHTDARIVVLVRDPARWQAIAAHHGLTTSRVTPIRGDITQSTLGLESKTIRRLGLPSLVIHSAADIVFSRPLADARRVNTEGTANVLALAATFPHARFVLVSSAFVVGRRTGTIADGDEAGDAGWVNSYEQSKHEAEAIVRSSGLDYTIARLSTIVCDDVHGSVSQVNAVHRALRLYHGGLASMMPGTEDTPIDIIPADWAAASVTTLALSREAHGRTLNLCAGDGALPLGALLDRTYAIWSRDLEWRRRGIARPALTDLVTYELFERSVELVGDARLKRITRSLSHFIPQLALPKRFDTSGADAILEQAAPPVIAYWDRMLQRLLDANWNVALPEAA